jgi:hypothetical protein
MVVVVAAGEFGAEEVEEVGGVKDPPRSGSLRVRRSHVRVLPSAPGKTPQIAGFRFWSYRLRVDLTTYLGEKRFEKVVVRGEIPKHYLTVRRILFCRKELEEWLIGQLVILADLWSARLHPQSLESAV